MEELKQRIADLESKLIKNNEYLDKLSNLLIALKKCSTENNDIQYKALADVVRHNTEIPLLQKSLIQLEEQVLDAQKQLKNMAKQ